MLLSDTVVSAKLHRNINIKRRKLVLAPISNGIQPIKRDAVWQTLPYTKDFEMTLDFLTFLVHLGTISDAYAFTWANLVMNVIF